MIVVCELVVRGAVVLGVVVVFRGWWFVESG